MSLVKGIVNNALFYFSSYISHALPHIIHILLNYASKFAVCWIDGCSPNCLAVCFTQLFFRQFKPRSRILEGGETRLSRYLMCWMMGFGWLLDCQLLHQSHMFFTVRTLRSALPRLRSVGLPPVYRTVNGVCMIVRLGSAVVRALDLRSTARGFDSWPPHCRVASDPGQVGHTCAQRLWSYDNMALWKIDWLI